MKIRILILTSLIVLVCKMVSTLEPTPDIKTEFNMSTLKTDLSSTTILLENQFVGLIGVRLNRNFLFN